MGKIVGLEQLKNIVREPNIIELLPGMSRHPEILAPMLAAMGSKEIAGSNMGVGFAYITAPLLMIDAAHKHPFDQYLFFIGGDGKDFFSFDAEIDLSLDNVVKKITYPSYVFVPKGMDHCPLVVKRVTKPFLFIDARLTKEASVRPTSG